MLGEQAWRGVEIARQMVNEKGGVNGRQIEIVNGDAPDPNAAATEAERLISKEGVPVIIGSLTSGNALAIAAVTERNGVLLWETSGISDDVTSKGYKYLVRTCDMGSVRGRFAVKLTLEGILPLLNISVGQARIAMVYEDSSYGQSQLKGALESMKQANKEFVLSEGYTRTATDLSALVLRIRDAKPDVLIGVGYINDTLLLINQLMQYEALPKVVVGGGAGYTDPQLSIGLGKHAEGILGIDMPTNLPLEMLKSPEVRQVAVEFRKRYMQQFNATEVPLSAETGFMGGYSLFNDVLPKAATLTADGILAAARGINIPETVMGWSVQFDETGQNVGALPIAYQWQDGVKVMVWPPDYAAGTFKGIPLAAAK
jgi:branched-chain amino acid transport system substrate-binding protein